MFWWPSLLSPVSIYTKQVHRWSFPAFYMHLWESPRVSFCWNCGGKSTQFIVPSLGFTKIRFGISSEITLGWCSLAPPPRPQEIAQVACGHVGCQGTCITFAAWEGHSSRSPLRTVDVWDISLLILLWLGRMLRFSSPPGILPFLWLCLGQGECHALNLKSEIIHP